MSAGALPAAPDIAVGCAHQTNASDGSPDPTNRPSSAIATDTDTRTRVGAGRRVRTIPQGNRIAATRLPACTQIDDGQVLLDLGPGVQHERDKRFVDQLCEALGVAR